MRTPSEILDITIARDYWFDTPAGFEAATMAIKMAQREALEEVIARAEKYMDRRYLKCNEGFITRGTVDDIIAIINEMIEENGLEK